MGRTTGFGRRMPDDRDWHYRLRRGRLAGRTKSAIAAQVVVASVGAGRLQRLSGPRSTRPGSTDVWRERL